MATLTRRDRLANIIRNYCHRDSARFTVTIGNNYHHRPGKGPDDLGMLTDAALEMVACDLVKHERDRKRRNERNRAIYAAQQARSA